MALLGIGIVIGAMLGVTIMTLCVISKECEKWEEELNDKRKLGIFKR